MYLSVFLIFSLIELLQYFLWTKHCHQMLPMPMKFHSCYTMMYINTLWLTQLEFQHGLCDAMYKLEIKCHYRHYIPRNKSARQNARFFDHVSTTLETFLCSVLDLPFNIKILGIQYVQPMKCCNQRWACEGDTICMIVFYFEPRRLDNRRVNTWFVLFNWQPIYRNCS